MSGSMRQMNSRKRREAKLVILKRQGGTCLLCPATVDLTFHHIIPISKGGSRTQMENLCLMCEACHGNVHGKPGWTGIQHEGSTST